MQSFFISLSLHPSHHPPKADRGAKICLQLGACARCIPRNTQSPFPLRLLCRLRILATASTIPPTDTPLVIEGFLCLSGFIGIAPSAVSNGHIPTIVIIIETIYGYIAEKASRRILKT